ncbi:MAG: hypothetical protein HXX16_03790 [Bacteroidales bacterium]|nr:hypothetical protein [Bacteroidales bacterium]
MSNQLYIGSITSGYRQIRDGNSFDKYFAQPDERDRIIIEDGEVEQTVDLMKRVVWKYIDDTKRIAPYLKDQSLIDTCENIWNFLYHHIQYRLDKKGLEQLRRPNRSWAERRSGIDCDCFSIFVSSILTNLKIPHSFRITKYGKDVFQHVYVIVPQSDTSQYIIIDCVLNQFNYEKSFTEKKDFAMNLNGINVAVLSGAGTNDVMELVSGLDDMELLGADNETQRLQSLYEHLVKTRNLIASKPELISSVDYPPAFLKMLDYAIENWNTPNRDKALEILSRNEDAMNRLNGFTGIPNDPEMDGLDDRFMDLEGDENYVEGLGSFKSFFKKVGEAAKKGGKFFLRFNPITISARLGFLLAMKLNLKKMASKIKWGYATKEQAAAKGVSAQDWEKSKNALTKIEHLFVDKLQGTRSGLKSAVLKGKAGGINGIEQETDISGLGILPAVALAAAIPVITSALKILQESGVMSKKEADNIESEVNAKAGEANKMADDPDIKNAGDSTDKTVDASNPDTSNSGGGIIGFVKRQPLIAIGGAALGIWGLTKLLGKKKKDKGLSGTPFRKHKRPRGKSKASPKGHKKLKSIKLT